ncbi:MAG TPA: hypothetical protein VF041_02745 [Gemmatimonadaceae bacterium]
MRRTRRLISALALPLPLLALAPLGCRDAASALGTAPAEARANAHELFGALAARFGPHARDARLDSLRLAFARSALVPRRLWDDPAIWTASTPVFREVDVAGAGTPGRYHLGVVPTLPALLRPGDYRRELRLTSLGGHDFQWTARDELAVGPVAGDDLARALGALFRAAEHGSERDVRAAYARVLPRATAQLALLFSLDTLHLAPNAAGGTDVRLSIGVHTDRLAARLPRYAKYLDKYARPTMLHLVVADTKGRDWWRLHKDDDRITIWLRVHDGALAPLAGPLAGPPARMPDSMGVRMDASTKAWIFRVGLERLHGEVTLVRDPHEKAFIARFREEPDWQLPPLVGAMLHTPLRRPFQGEGAMIALGVRDGSSAQTVVTRDYRLAVRESRIMRWFGGLGSSALGDFRRGAEEEFDRYNGDVLLAVQRDLDEAGGLTPLTPP